MRPDTARQASALIDHIQARFHEGHRKALAQLQPMAATLAARGIDGGLMDALLALGDALERHMFKEEMRLFPMMEQGGNTLITQLIADLHREHVEHQLAMQGLRMRADALSRAFSADPGIGQLAEAVQALADELALHVRAEDEDLFPMFVRPEPPAGPAAVNPVPRNP